MKKWRVENLQKSVASQICVVLLISFLVVSLSSMWQGGFTVSAQGLGYSSAFQGPKAEFYGVTYNGKQYMATQANGASESHFSDTVMHFDADSASSGKPKIDGEMTSIFLPEQSLTQIPAWVPLSWIQDLGYVSNPVTGVGGVNPPYSWNITGNTYKMAEYDMRYWVSLSSSWSGSEDPSPQLSSSLFGYAYNVYQNVGVWIKLDISPSWYIQGGGTAYFAIALCTLAENVQMSAKGNSPNGPTYAARTDENVDPYSRPSVSEMYYNPWGGATPPNDEQQTAMQYNGKDLNPAYFVNTLYMHMDLVNFGTWAGVQNAFSTYTRGDVATFAFDFKVFVIGEYTVKDIQNNPSQYGRFTPVATSGTEWFTSIIAWLSNPANIALLTTIGIFLAILFVAPWILVVIAAILMGGKKR